MFSKRGIKQLVKTPSTWLAFLTSTVIAVGFLLAINTIAGRVQNNCQQINGLKALIGQDIISSANQLGRPGSAGYAYYSAHPQELAAAKAQTLAQVKFYAPTSCN